MKTPVIVTLLVFLASPALATEYNIPLPGCDLIEFPLSCRPPVVDCGAGGPTVRSDCGPWVGTMADLTGVPLGLRRGIDMRIAFTIDVGSCDSVQVLLQYEDREGRIRKIPLALTYGQGGDFQSENLERLRYPLRTMRWITTRGWGSPANYAVTNLRITVTDQPSTKQPTPASWGQVKGLYR